MFSSIEGVAAIEVIILILLGSLFILVIRGQKEAKQSRASIYKFIKDEFKALREEMDKRFKEVWESINDHNETCNLKNQRDAHWQGMMETEIKNINKELDKKEKDQ